MSWSPTIEALQSRRIALRGHRRAGQGRLARSRQARSDVVIPAMNAVRAAGDQLETLVADDLWPLPTYQEMLFIK